MQYMFSKRYTALVALTLIASSFFAPIFTHSARAADIPADPRDSGFQILPDCTPWAFPSEAAKNPCNLSKFQELVVRVIKWLLYIIVPIGFCIVGWAGFKILTSAGNSEAIHEAYGMIKIVVIGVLIAALSYIIIVNVFKLLNVNATFTPIG